MPHRRRQYRDCETGISVWIVKLASPHIPLDCFRATKNWLASLLLLAACLILLLLLLLVGESGKTTSHLANFDVLERSRDIASKLLDESRIQRFRHVSLDDIVDDAR